MPTITTVDVAWLPSPTTFTDEEARRFDTAMFLGDGSNNGVRSGIVRHGANSLAVSVNGTDQVTVQAGACVIAAATGLGVYRGALSAATSATAIDARNATNPRIDLVVFRATGAVDIITGTPGSSPSAPALPANTVELGRLNVPALGGGAVTVSGAFRTYAAALGGTLYVETAARLPMSGNLKLQRAVALDSGVGYEWTNDTAWVAIAGPPATVTLSGGTGALSYSLHSGLASLDMDFTSNGTAAGAGIAVLPSMAWPAFTRYVSVINQTTGTMHLVSIATNGVVAFVSATAAGHRFLDSPVYRL